MGEKGRGRRAKKAKCEEDVVGGQSRVGLYFTVRYFKWRRKDQVRSGEIR